MIFPLIKSAKIFRILNYSQTSYQLSGVIASWYFVLVHRVLQLTALCRNFKIHQSQHVTHQINCKTGLIQFSDLGTNHLKPG